MLESDEPAWRALREGQVLLELSRPAEAAVALSRAVASDPTNVVAHASLALAELNQHHDSRARSSAERALSLDGEYEWAHRILSVALLRLKDRAGARREALAAIKLAPDEFRGYTVLADALLVCKDLAGAREAAERAVALAPEEPTAHVSLAYVYLELGQWPESEAAAREALELDPNDASALNNLAVAILRQRHRRAEAVSIFEAAARVSSRNSTVRGNILMLGHTSSRRHMSATTRELVADDARARRFHPTRWDWGRVTRFRPWWWTVLKRIPAPVGLGINVVVVILCAIGPATAPDDLVYGLFLPFTARRFWRWWGIRHPSARSWRPSGANDMARPAVVPREADDVSGAS